jgi:predicted nucleic acid-binding protein
MKLRVYLDTSIFSAYYDDRLPERQSITKEFWERISDFEVSTSEIARQELSQTYDESLRTNLLSLQDDFIVHPVNDDIIDLANHYISAEVFSSVMFNDALHVAVAVITRQDILLSWNFKHLVNRKRRLQINQINAVLELPMIEIMAPPEL